MCNIVARNCCTTVTLTVRYYKIYHEYELRRKLLRLFKYNKFSNEKPDAIHEKWLFGGKHVHTNRAVRMK